VILCPALNHDFLLSVELDRIATLPVRTPKKLSFHPLKGNTHRGRNPDVDADVAGRRFVTEPSRRRPAGGK